MKENKVKKENVNKVEFFRLKFPKFNKTEVQLLQEWADLMKYKLEYNPSGKKALVINENNPERSKIAYLQKRKGRIRLVFNNRFEDITDTLMITKMINRLTPIDAHKTLLKFVLSSTELEYAKSKQSIQK